MSLDRETVMKELRQLGGAAIVRRNRTADVRLLRTLVQWYRLSPRSKPAVSQQTRADG